MPKDTSLGICFSNRFWQPLQLRLFHISWMENMRIKNQGDDDECDTIMRII